MFPSIQQSRNVNFPIFVPRKERLLILELTNEISLRIALVQSLSAKAIFSKEQLLIIPEKWGAEIEEFPPQSELPSKNKKRT